MAPIDAPAPVRPDVVTEPGTKIHEHYKSALALESPHRVIVHNDDVTTFEFVITLMIVLFKHTASRANEIAWETHHNGFSFVCSLPLNEARQKVNAAHQAARQANFPLRFTIEPGWLGN